jgi:catechol 2,3-dioxygenase-like lactoylglutathione lyase family enzyme
VTCASSRWIKGANLTVELWQFLHPVTTPPPLRAPHHLGYHALCLEVADLTISVAHALECGAQLITDGDAEAWLHDPDGNLLWLVESAHLPMPSIQTFAEPTIIARINTLWQRA